MDGTREQFLAGAGFAFDQDRDRAQRNAAGACDHTLHHGALVDDGIEGRGGRWQAGSQPREFGIRTAQQIRDEICGHLERNRDRSHTVADGRFDQFGWEPGLGEDDPDRSHRGCARTEVKGEFGLAGGAVCERLGNDTPRMPIDGIEVGWAVQLDLMQCDGSQITLSKPVEIVLGF
ncbi:MAG: hypothetical protein ACLFQI_05410 [Halochromatium sp.]|uniref:hypothetical protein n=1 Tax=Halochromatium sp. TaxID=2049430 RepID=UPI00397C8717